jgi:hypothetical protein
MAYDDEGAYEGKLIENGHTKEKNVEKGSK